MKVIKYGLKLIKTNEILRYSLSSNDGDECCANEYYLSKYGDNEWLVGTAEHAEWVRNNTTKWYNADYATPRNDYKAEDLKVVKIEMERNEEEVEVKIPTFKEVMLTLDKIGKEHSNERLIDNPQYEQKYYLYQLNKYLRYIKGGK